MRKNIHKKNIVTIIKILTVLYI